MVRNVNKKKRFKIVNLLSRITSHKSYSPRNNYDAHNISFCILVIDLVVATRCKVKREACNDT